MQDTDIPIKMPTIWAASAGGSYVHDVPIPSQEGTTPGAASFETGFPPLNFIAEGSGGIPPFGQDMNGVFKAVTGWLRWVQAGAPVIYDSVFATAVGGYPKGAILQASAGGAAWWLSTIDNNMNNPDPSGNTGWLAVAPGISQAAADARYGQLTAGNRWQKANFGDEVSASIVANVLTLDLSNQHFIVSGIAANFQFANPINVPTGKIQSGQITYVQNSAGGHTVTYPGGTNVIGINGNKPNLTAGANGTDIWLYSTQSNGKIFIASANAVS